MNSSINSIINDLYQNALTVNDKGSGWSIHHIRSMEVYLVRSTLRGGGDVSRGRPKGNSRLGDSIGPAICGTYNSKGLRAIQDYSGECLKSSIIYSLEKEHIRRSHKTRVQFNEYAFDGERMKADYGQKYNWDGMEYPSSVYDLITFQENNYGLNICFHVHTITHDFAERYRTASEKLVDPESAKHIHLVLAPYEKYSDMSIYHHWIVVDDFTKFQTVRYFGTRTGKSNATYSGTISCNRCYRKFGKDNNEALYRHEQTCEGVGRPNINMPAPGSKESFSKYGRCYRKRFAAFFDLETYHTELPDLCMECDISHQHADNEFDRKQIIERCVAMNHIRIRKSGCKKCEIISKSKMRIVRETCKHNTPDCGKWQQYECCENKSPSSMECASCYEKMRVINDSTKCDKDCVGVCTKVCRSITTTYIYFYQL